LAVSSRSASVPTSPFNPTVISIMITTFLLKLYPKALPVSRKGRLIEKNSATICKYSCLVSEKDLPTGEIFSIIIPNKLMR